MTTKTKIIIALIIVALLAGLSIFFYNRGKKSSKKQITKNESDLTGKLKSTRTTATPVSVKETKLSIVNNTTDEATPELVN